ncbi:MAG TPA: DUF2207 domain-containing protein [Beutenbergiaceae bacterium]|nr:DUF2207 domain-containing protein [Beutenbergiaceae bacterium]
MTLRYATSAAAVAGLAVAILAGSAPPAHADAGDDVVRHLDVNMYIDADGWVRVTETYEWDFGDREGLGLRRELAQHFSWPEDPDLMRVYEYGEISVSSPSGAPADHWVTGDDAYLSLDIGAPDGSDDTRTGVQTYELRYTLGGALNAIRDDDEVPDQDELFWNVTGSEWDNRIERVTTTVTGPVSITDVRCWEGASYSDRQCRDSQVDGATATFTSGPLNPGQEQTIAVAFPPGTFDDIGPILVPRDGSVTGLTAEQQRVAEVTDPILNTLARYWVIPAGLVGLVFAVLLTRRFRQGRDDHFVGIPLGTMPPRHEIHQHPVARLERHQSTTAVRFSPPDGLAPAVAGHLEHKFGSANALAATIVDLAVRGFLTIQEADTDRKGKPKDWHLLLAPEAHQRRGELLPYEDQLLTALFDDGPVMQLKSSTRKMQKARTELGKNVTKQVDAQGLFTRPLEAEARRELGMTPRGRSLVWQIGLAAALLLAALLGAVLDLLPPSAVTLLLIAFGVVGGWLIIRMASFSTSLRRSAVGRALYEQIRGFRTYLTTAEANQIRFEESIDVFSRYLPFAIIFGVAERWAKVFEELQAQGRAQVYTGWYIGAYPGATPSLSTLATSVGSFSTTVAGTSGSGGGSGFGGGGGAGGGGGGGGGGGR